MTRSLLDGVLFIIRRTSNYEISVVFVFGALAFSSPRSEFPSGSLSCPLWIPDLTLFWPSRGKIMCHGFGSIEPSKTPSRPSMRASLKAWLCDLQFSSAAVVLWSIRIEDLRDPSFCSAEKDYDCDRCLGLSFRNNGYRPVVLHNGALTAPEREVAFGLWVCFLTAD